MVRSSPAELPAPQVIGSFPALCSIRAHAAGVCRVRGLDDQRHRLTGLAPMLAGRWADEQALCIHTAPTCPTASGGALVYLTYLQEHC